MKYIERNLHPAGRVSNIKFGLAQVADGIVRVLSLGYLHTSIPVTVSRNQARRMIAKLKELT